MKKTALPGGVEQGSRATSMNTQSRGSNAFVNKINFEPFFSVRILRILREYAKDNLFTVVVVGNVDKSLFL